MFFLFFKLVLLNCSVYPLLFKELLKYTPEDHSDYKGVLSTLRTVEEVSANVNKLRADKLNFEKLIEFNSTVEGFQVDLNANGFVLIPFRIMIIFSQVVFSFVTNGYLWKSLPILNL